MSLVQQQIGRKPLVSFAATNRARLVGVTGQTAASMPAVTRRRAAAGARRRRGGKSKVRFVKGRVVLRVAGYAGARHLSPAHLVRHISAAKLRLAAKQVLRKTARKGGAVKKKRRRKRKTKKRRKGRRRKRRKLRR
jgi:hypothetical protein